eukprot:Phypoly_transcript_24843.p1 GENE.Phypoly_transcript_24843~~Phypoly_transcript_24843.p1  ORF type:complete len:102 (+),score=14.77 Phypoly_transcript_24843:45-308(+)
MSEAQLKKILAENQALQQQAERSKHIIKTSIACQEYAKPSPRAQSYILLTVGRMVEYVTKQQDPFIPGFAEPNPWHSNQGGGFCAVI